MIQFSSDFLYQVSSSLQKDQVLEISPDAEPFLMLDGEHRKSLDDLYQKRFYNRICNKKGNLAEEWQMDAVILQFLAKLLENGSIQLHQGYGGKEEIQQISDVIHYLMANPAERLDMRSELLCVQSFFSRDDWYGICGVWQSDSHTTHGGAVDLQRYVSGGDFAGCGDEFCKLLHSFI